MDWLTFISLMTQALAWPLALLLAVWMFRKPILLLIPALRELKVMGAELKFEVAAERMTSQVLEEVKLNVTKGADIGWESLKNAGGAAPEMLTREAQRRDLKRFVERLESRDRRIIVLHYFEEMDFKDIAAELGMDEQDVRGRMRWILSQLKRRLRDAK